MNGFGGSNHNVASSETKVQIKSRKDYEEHCKQCVHQFLKDHDNHVLIEYVRLPFAITTVKKMDSYSEVKTKGRAIGAVVAFRDLKTKEVRFGWSLCHMGQDEYNRHVAVWRAIERAINPPSKKVFEDRYKSIFEQKVVKFLEPMKERAKKYFV